MRLSPGMRSIRLLDRSTFNALFMLQHLAPASTRLQRWRDHVRLRIAAHLQHGGKGKVVPVERVRHLSAKDFRRRYLATGTPVIIDKGAAHWTCAQRWSFETFRERFGQATLKLVHHKGLTEDGSVLAREYSEEVKIGEFLDQALDGGTRYVRFSPFLEMFPELLDDLDTRFLRQMPGWMSLGTTFEAFIGGKDTFTPLHNEPIPFLFVNVCGVKRWPLIPNHYLPVLNPPADGMSYNHSSAKVDEIDVERFPGFDCIDRLEAVLEPGDILFMPSWLWHSVRNETPTIGVRCGIMYPKGMFAEAMTLFLIRVFAARNPNLLQALYYTLFEKNLGDRETMLLQPRMYWNLNPLQAMRESALGQRLLSRRTAGIAERH